MGLGVLLSLQPVGAEVCRQQLMCRLKSVAGLAGFLDSEGV